MSRQEPVGVAMLGAAHTTHAWSYARALSAADGVHVVGLHDAEPEHARWIRQDFGVPMFDDPSALLGRPEVTAAVVCTETLGHRAMVELAAEHGVHVLCEKPLATTLEDAEACVRACDEAGVQLHIAFVSRFLPLVARTRSAVREGRLGDLVGLVGGNRGRPPLPPAYPGWITDRTSAGGGAVIDHSVHVTDAMRHVSGLEVTAVSAECGSLLRGCGVEDLGVLSVRFEGGAVGSIDPSWSVPEGNPWDYDFYLRLLGTGGSVDISDDAASLHVVSTSGAARGLRLAPFAEDADAAMLDAFVASIRAGAHLDPCAAGADGVRALEVALAAYESAETGQVVRLPLGSRPVVSSS